LETALQTCINTSVEIFYNIHSHIPWKMYNFEKYSDLHLLLNRLS